LDAGRVRHAHDVGALVSGQREAGVRQESPGDGVRGELSWAGALEPDHPLALLLAVRNLVRVVADVELGGVGQPLLAGGLVRYTSRALEESSLASLANRVQTVLKSISFILHKTSEYPCLINIHENYVIDIIYQEITRPCSSGHKSKDLHNSKLKVSQFLILTILN